jgi:hypothetical protein
MKHKLFFCLLLFSFRQIYSSQNRKKKIIRISLTTIVSKTKLLFLQLLATARKFQMQQFFVTASGNSGDVIEWYDSQESSTILKTGSIFSPVISKLPPVQSRSVLSAQWHQCSMLPLMLV